MGGDDYRDRSTSSTLSIMIYSKIHLMFSYNFMLLKVNSGSSHMTYLPRMDISEVTVKEKCLFHCRDGSILRRDVQRLGKNVINWITSSYRL